MSKFPKLLISQALLKSFRPKLRCNKSQACSKIGFPYLIFKGLRMPKKQDTKNNWPNRLFKIQEWKIRFLLLETFLDLI